VNTEEFCGLFENFESTRPECRSCWSWIGYLAEATMVVGASRQPSTGCCAPAWFVPAVLAAVNEGINESDGFKKHVDDNP
jgi:hypothetical protein